MGLQLIFVVETNKKCNSDWIYIKDTIEHFYQYDNANVRFTVVYMDGKGNYKKKEKEITTWINAYSSAVSENSSQVLCCFDCDDYDLKPEDRDFISGASRYCEEKGYEFVWFCKDVERVYIGRKVNDSEKKKEAALFKAKKLIDNVDINRLSLSNYQTNTSNIVKILDKYLARKR